MIRPAGGGPLLVMDIAAAQESVLGLARALADGDVDLDPGTDRVRARTQLLALPGIGPWTVEVIAMRGLGDPDAFLPTDVGVRNALARFGAFSSSGEGP